MTMDTALPQSLGWAGSVGASAGHSPSLKISVWVSHWSAISRATGKFLLQTGSLPFEGEAG